VPVTSKRNGSLGSVEYQRSGNLIGYFAICELCWAAMARKLGYTFGAAVYHIMRPAIRGSRFSKSWRKSYTKIQRCWAED